ncbi:MAG: type VI secretion system protein TssA [Desulfovibrio sp.]|jgi:type VI secretion system protein VasJ|nr:type VI secretion system protein TssA [Desulfovibrio sp.]
MKTRRGLDQYLENWAKPLSEEAPCGEDCSYAPEFEAIRMEVDKDTSLHATEATNWTEISQLAMEFLSTQSKDVWVLVYAVYAEYRVKGLEACVPAVAALTHILRIWWDALYPSATRPQRRLAPLAWLCSRMEQAAETTCFMNETPESVGDLRNEFSELQKLLEENAGEAVPSFTGIFAKIPGSGQSAFPSDAVSSGIMTNQASPSQSIPTSIAANFAELDKDGRIPAGILPQLIRNILEQTRQLAVHFLSLNVTDERAYLLHRTAIWGTLLQLPPADANGMTQLSSGVPPDKIQAYTAAVAGKQYAEILPQLERAAGKAPFWLDGHVMVARCLEGLEAFRAAACVRETLTALLQRFPELLSYKFKDNTPFAPSKALSWLESLCASIPPPGQTASVPPKIMSLSEAEEDERLQEAISFGIEEGFQAGLRKLGIVPVGRSRAAVLHGIIQARYCVALGKKNAAIRLLLALYRQMEEWNLLDWEPALSAKILALLFSLQTKQSGEAAEDMIRRLHWLSLDTAFNVFQEN